MSINIILITDFIYIDIGYSYNSFFLSVRHNPPCMEPSAQKLYNNHEL